jgi:hypothetical protein
MVASIAREAAFTRAIEAQPYTKLKSSEQQATAALVRAGPFTQKTTPVCFGGDARAEYLKVTSPRLLRPPGKSNWRQRKIRGRHSASRLRLVIDDLRHMKYQHPRFRAALELQQTGVEWLLESLITHRMIRTGKDEGAE